MPDSIDLSAMSEAELTKLIDDATTIRDHLRERRRVGTATGTPAPDDGKHGAIPTPTPDEVKEIGPAHGVDVFGGHTDLPRSDQR